MKHKMLGIEPRLAFIDGVLLANRVLMFRFQLLAVYVLLVHNCGECRIYDTILGPITPSVALKTTTSHHNIAVRKMSPSKQLYLFNKVYQDISREICVLWFSMHRFSWWLSSISLRTLFLRPENFVEIVNLQFR
jgi:hypothetical protein